MSTVGAPRIEVHRTIRARLARARIGDLAFYGALVFLTALVLAALTQPLLVAMGWMYSPEEQNLLLRNSSPGTAADGSFHLLGTDYLGRDALSRIIRAAQFSLAVGALTVICSIVIGVIIGLLAGYYGGWLESVFMRLTDVFMSIPGLLLALFVLYVLGGGFVNVALVLALTRWPVVARVTRAAVLSLRERQFVLAAHTAGAGQARIMFREILPNLYPSIVVLGTLEFTRAMLSEAGLSFLGFGIRAPEASWGLMLAQARPYIDTAWWLIVFPGLSIMLTALAVNSLSGRVGMLVDPQLRSQIRHQSKRKSPTAG
ncbi:ABC transporter permease [Nesterenkonia muleiensis]|uniref:ABC transporter permease n=1 Tax=Nesterenkonia muleiensis TaxID=2282648 RepID=UPI000E76072D|nr:ABC transporter permease [Nesterenkonia muleiensis]